MHFIHTSHCLSLADSDTVTQTAVVSSRLRLRSASSHVGYETETN